jgi:hypothetical protein
MKQVFYGFEVLQLVTHCFCSSVYVNVPAPDHIRDVINPLNP